MSPLSSPSDGRDIAYPISKLKSPVCGAGRTILCMGAPFARPVSTSSSAGRLKYGILGRWEFLARVYGWVDKMPDRLSEPIIVQFKQAACRTAKSNKCALCADAGR